MNDDLLRALAHDLGADTADCPSLVHRVAAGVARRRRRRRVVAGSLAAVAFLVAGPAVVLDTVGSSRTDNTAVLCGGASVHCGQILSARAQLALRRANSPDFSTSFGSLILSNSSPTDSCLHRAFCRGPV